MGIISIENEQQYNESSKKVCDFKLQNIETFSFFRDEVAVNILNILQDNPEYHDVKLDFIAEICGQSPSFQDNETFKDFLESDDLELSLTNNVSYIKK